jgi:murein DD-endopeptidase MepM/ murein hydrolase activator NlpD
MQVCQAARKIRLAGLSAAPVPSASCSRLVRPAPGVIACALLLSVLLSACAPPAATPPASVARHGAYHIVKPGENLFRIAKIYGLSYEEMARANNIKDPRHIVVGQRIFIPGGARQRPVEENAVAGLPERDGTPGEPVEHAFLWPVSGSLNSGFGPRGSGFHDGLDIAAPEGTPIRAVERGEVIYSDELRGYGKIVIVRHGGGIVSVYAHNQVNLVREGQQVARGEIIARVGSTGRVTGPHLHFEIRKNNLAQDPMLYLPPLCCVPASDMVAPNG